MEEDEQGADALEFGGAERLVDSEDSDADIYKPLDEDERLLLGAVAQAEAAEMGAGPAAGPRASDHSFGSFGLSMDPPRERAHAEGRREDAGAAAGRSGGLAPSYLSEPTWSVGEVREVQVPGRAVLEAAPAYTPPHEVGSGESVATSVLDEAVPFDARIFPGPLGRLHARQVAQRQVSARRDHGAAPGALSAATTGALSATGAGDARAEEDVEGWEEEGDEEDDADGGGRGRAGGGGGGGDPHHDDAGDAEDGDDADDDAARRRRRRRKRRRGLDADSPFAQGAWQRLCALYDVDASKLWSSTRQRGRGGGEGDGVQPAPVVPLRDIAAAPADARTGIPLVLGAVLAIQLPQGPDGGALVLIADPTGQMWCAVDRRALRDAGASLAPGAALALANVAFFSPASGARYLNVQADHIALCLGPATVPPRSPRKRYRPTPTPALPSAAGTPPPSASAALARRDRNS
jgi:hypothetical protein